MTEFSEVVKQWRRMCKSFEDAAAKEYKPCMEKCPVGANPVCGELCEATQEDIEKFEEVIMKWAKENPEPVYPTWKDWMFGSGIISNATLCEIQNMKYIYADLCKYIPADIAQKLGLQPNEEI